MSDTTAEVFVNGMVREVTGLAPSADHRIEGLPVRTLPGIGDVRAVVATVNDVHFGEVECGKVEGSVPAQFVAEPGARPYPEVMNESVIADIAARTPDAVVVKGDLTSFGTRAEYDDFLSFYEPAFGDRLTHVRGNHDSYPGEVFADWSVQVVDVTGLRIILLDTSRAHESGGFVSDDQIEATVEAARSSTDTVIVMGHHPLMAPGLESLRRSDGVREVDAASLIAAVAPLKNVVAYTAGHTHRNRVFDVDGLLLVEVACVKDFPGAWAEYRVGTTGICQMVHRASGPDAIAWAERTRGMFDGYYGTYAMGELTDRCFVVPLSRP